MPVRKAKFLLKLAGILSGIFAFVLGVQSVLAAITSYSGVDVSATVGSVAPTITSINPSSVTAGASAFTMDIYGTDFEALAVARFNGSGRVTTFISPTHLQVNILATDVASAGTYPITVWNPGTALLSNSVNFIVNAPSGGSGGGGGAGDTAPPVISNVQAISITQTTARIIWDTDESATSVVYYGITNAYGDVVSSGSLVMSHGLDLTGLTPGTLYHFKVSSADQYGNSASSVDYTFTTLTWPTLVISNVTSTSITDTSANIIWDTNRSATSKVLYGTTPALGLWTSVPGYVLNHTVPLTSLSPNTLYYYQVTSVDGGSVSATSSVYTFRTGKDVTPPSNITLTATPGDTVVKLDWTQPPEPDFVGVRIVRKIGGYPTGPNDGTLVYSGLAITTLDTGLTNGTKYYYAAYSYDTSGNFSSGALASATPIGTIQQPPTSTPPIPPATTTPPVITPPVITPPVVTPPVVTPPVVTPPVVTPPTQPSLSVTVAYYTSNGTLLLQPDDSGIYGVSAGASVLAKVPTDDMGATPQTATLEINGQVYSLALSPDGKFFTGTFIAPTIGTFPSDVKVTFADSRQAQAVSQFAIQAAGLIVESTITGPTPALPNATVTLEELVDGVWQTWNGAPYGQANPTQSGPDGSYVYVVPNGTYRAKVDKNDYQPEISQPITVKRNVFGDQVSLIKLPQVMPATTTPTVIQTVEAVPEYARFAALNVLRIARTQPFKDAVSIAVPAVLAVSILNAASAFSLFNLLAYLQFLFTQPLLLFGRTKRKRWGVIYNSLTKQPIEFAIVRLINQESKLVVQTRVTDKEGRFIFQAKKGIYVIEAMKPGFEFPSQYLADQKQDLDYPDLYHGETINLQEDGIVALNIPLDPIESAVTPRKIVVRKYLKRVQHSLALLGVILAGVAFIIVPTTFVGIVFIIQAAFYLLFRRLALPAKARNWGRVYDAATRKPLGRAVVRIFDKKFNKLLETQLTDNDGGFGFFVGRNTYYLTVEKQGFDKWRSKDIDLTSGKELVVDMDVGLSAERSA